MIPKKLPVSSPIPIPGRREDIIIAAGTTAGAVATVPATTGAVTSPPTPAVSAVIAPPVVPTVCRTDTRGPIRLDRAGIRGSGEGTGEPRERRNTDMARRNTWGVEV